MTLAPICILAGGLGTRLGEIVHSVPKALIEVAGEPFVNHQLRSLRRAGAQRVVICVGHFSDQIEEVVGDGAHFGLCVDYSHDGPSPVGTAGAVRGALTQLGETFFVLYGDTFLRIDYAAVQRRFHASGQPALMTVLRNASCWDTSNAVVEAGHVVAYDKAAPTVEMRWIDYGLGLFTADALRSYAVGASDLADVYRELAGAGKLAAFEATQRFYEIGTPGALASTDEFLRGLSDDGN